VPGVALRESLGALLGLVEQARDPRLALAVDERLEVPGDLGDVVIGMPVVGGCSGDPGRVVARLG
jgi:hypothetical protein